MQKDPTSPRVRAHKETFAAPSGEWPGARDRIVQAHIGASHYAGFMTRTRQLLRPHVQLELSAARSARQRRDYQLVWQHLERAHVLSQPSARLHTRVHVSMLVTALLVMDVREVVGQLVRLSVAGVGSLLGRYPLGNTGRARVPITLPMPIPGDLQTQLGAVERANSEV